MGIKVINPGLLSTVQDAGRYGFLDQAVPISGAMDQLAYRIANILVGNATNEAVIEFTYGGIELLTTENLLISITGACSFFKIDDQKIPTYQPVFVPANSIIQIDYPKNGKHTYLAVAGGWDVPEVLGSRSTFLTAAFGGFHGRALKKDDELKPCSNLSEISQRQINNLSGDAVTYPNWGVSSFQFQKSDDTINIIKGNERDWFQEEIINQLESKSYKITDGNRMGYHLAGELLERNSSQQAELLSTAVVPGTIQVTNNGSLILLMADCQTTGGYPRLGKVIETDLPKCAQLRPGDSVKFKFISLKEAEKLYLEQESDLRKLSAAISLKVFYGDY